MLRLPLRDQKPWHQDELDDHNEGVLRQSLVKWCELFLGDLSEEEIRALDVLSLREMKYGQHPCDHAFCAGVGGLPKMNGEFTSSLATALKDRGVSDVSANIFSTGFSPDTWWAENLISDGETGNSGEATSHSINTMATHSAATHLRKHHAYYSMTSEEAEVYIQEHGMK